MVTYVWPDTVFIGLFVFGNLVTISSAFGNEKLSQYTHRIDDIVARNISPMVPPIVKEGKIDVKISYKLARVIRLVSDSATLEVLGSMRVSWLDARYAWNISAGPDSIVFPIDRLWIPDLSLTTSSEFSLRRELKGWGVVHMQYNGNLVLEHTMRFTVACEVDVKYFPRDIQVCSLGFKATVPYRDILSPTQMKSLSYSPSKNVGEEWALIAINHKVNEERVFHPNGTEVSVPTYHLCLLLNRNHAFYFLTIIVPSLLLATLVILPPLLPSTHANPKLLIPVTTFLSFNIYMLLLERSLPKSSQVPVLGQAYAILLGSCALTELCQTVSINLYSRSTAKIPRPLAFIYQRILGPLCCVRCRKGTVYVDDESSHSTGRNKEPQDPKEIWQEMGRINDRFGLLCTSLLIIFAFIYLFVVVDTSSNHILKSEMKTC